MSAKRQRFSLPLLATVFVVVGALAGLTHGALFAARERARRLGCRSRLWHLAHACVLYSGDNEGRFPPDSDPLFVDYVTDGECFLCLSACKATEPLYSDFHHPGSSGSIHPEHTDYVYVSGLTAADPPSYIMWFEDEWNHEGDGVYVAYIGGGDRWKSVQTLHTCLAAQEKELAAQGREMKLLRPAWSAWPDPSVSSHPLAGPRPWYRRRNGSAVLVGASVGIVTALVMAVVMFRRRRRREEAGSETGQPPASQSEEPQA